jgi:glycine dehydrogenase
MSLTSNDIFRDRHIGPSENQIKDMLAHLGLNSLDELMSETLPDTILMDGKLTLPEPLTESELLARASEIAYKNQLFRSYIGMGYSPTVTPPVIQRGILESPSWYTQYTPYQAEISQGRLEALLNFQTAVIDLTGMEIANASLLDEATAAAEAMMMLFRTARGKDRVRFLVSSSCHPQTIDVVKTRAEPIGLEIVVGDHTEFSFNETVVGALVQYPATDGVIYDYSAFCSAAHRAGASVVVAADLMSLALLTPPGEFGADVAVGSTQRFGVPMGYGGPHAAFFATKEKFKRQKPGRIIGVSEDADGNPALRMALQTREQHIRRDKATSNICTSQVLLAVMASMYAVYHGPEGITAIAGRIHGFTRALHNALSQLGFSISGGDFFDTISVIVSLDQQDIIRQTALKKEINLRYFEDGRVGISMDETISDSEFTSLISIFEAVSGRSVDTSALLAHQTTAYSGSMSRSSAFMEHPVFHSHRSEAELTRYMYKLSSKDLSLTTSMIPLGSCTMKLNATAELLSITKPEFNRIHPFVPVDQVTGYMELMGELEEWLAEITGFAATSLQPNSGASGEYAGLLVIRAFHQSRGQGHRNICLIPSSAHGTNPASAVMAGMKVVVVACDENGNIDINDLETRAKEHADHLAAFMVTYPSTHGVFEEGIRRICDIMHEYGGQVYMDGANMNAQTGLCRPGDQGADVCHLNLHKTFAIPHGGGGPGVGPICVAEHLAEFLPGHSVINSNDSPNAIGAVAAAPFGSASILPISWAYIAMLGEPGLRRSTQVAILNANYMAARLADHYDILYTGAAGRIAHEFILDLRHLRQNTALTEVDVAKRLMDYGFHAPTMSFPVMGTMMVEPTESESRPELDRFCDAMISIRAEIQEVSLGLVDADVSVLANAPHTAQMLLVEDWDAPYTREKAAYPAPWTRDYKFWPSCRRINDAVGDRNLICACPPIEAYSE